MAKRPRAPAEGFAKHPEEISTWDALALVLPSIPQEDRRVIFPPPNWARGIKPTGRAAIKDLDAIIEKTAKDSSNSENSGVILPCPYYAARYHVAIAVDCALREVENEKQIRKERLAGGRLQRLEIEFTGIAERLTRLFFDDENPDRFRPMEIAPERQRGFVWPNYDEVTGYIWRTEDLLKKLRSATDALDELSALARKERERIPLLRSDARSPWEYGFIDWLGHFWHMLTNKNPSPAANSPFAQFVRAAYAAIGGIDDDISDAVIRATVEDVRGVGGKGGRDREDQFDKYARSIQAVDAYRREIGEDRCEEEESALRETYINRRAARVILDQNTLLEALKSQDANARLAACFDIFDRARRGSQWALETLQEIFPSLSEVDQAFLLELGYKHKPKQRTAAEIQEREQWADVRAAMLKLALDAKAAEVGDPSKDDNEGGSEP